MENPSQYDLIKDHLESGKTLTRLEALTEMGILNPTAVISTLRQSGIPIETRMIRVRNRWDAVCKVGQWYIPEQDKPLFKRNRS